MKSGWGRPRPSTCGGAPLLVHARCRRASPPGHWRRQLSRNRHSRDYEPVATELNESTVGARVSCTIAHGGRATPPCTTGEQTRCGRLFGLSGCGANGRLVHVHRLPAAVPCAGSGYACSIRTPTPSPTVLPRSPFPPRSVRTHFAHLVRELRRASEVLLPAAVVHPSPHRASCAGVL